MATTLNHKLHGAASRSSDAISGGQGIALAVIGVILWFVAAMMLRYLQPLGALDGGWRVLTYALVVPGTAPFIFATERLVGIARHQLVTAITIVTGSALLTDGIAVGRFPGIYGDEPLKAAATVMWGAGVALMLGLIIGARRR